MDIEINETSGDQSAQQAPQNGATAKRTIDTVKLAIRTGAHDARRAAEEALPQIKPAASKAVYWASYGVTYVTVFEWTLVQAGAIEGIKAGRNAARKWIERIRDTKRAPEPVALIGPVVLEPDPVGR